MPRPKGSKNKSTSTAPKGGFDPRIEEMYETEIEFTCPVRGKVKQKVQVKRFRDNASYLRPIIMASDPVSELEAKDDGLSIYSEEELESQ